MRLTPNMKPLEQLLTVDFDLDSAEQHVDNILLDYTHISLECQEKVSVIPASDFNFLRQLRDAIREMRQTAK